MTLDQILKADGATHLEITFSDGRAIAVCSVDEELNEIAVYEGHDLDSEMLKDIAAKVPVSENTCTRWPNE